MTIGYPDFERVDIRAGTVLAAEPLEGARKPAYKLRVDFGPEIGERNSSVQITAVYRAEELIGTQVCAVVNFEPKRIAGFMSEVLVRPQYPVPNGRRLY